MHLNYESRAAQRGRRPGQPSYFFKPPSSVSGDGDPIVRPQGMELLTFEAEVALIIGRAARNVSLERALDHVGWYAPSNDVGVYDMRWNDRGSNVMAKGHDGFTPVGPPVSAGDVDPGAIALRALVNGELAQDDSTANLIFPFALLIADLSRFMTLEPGDMILTGTPAGSRPVEPGDVVEVELRGLSSVRNPVVEAGEPIAPFGAQPRVSPATRAAALGVNAPRPVTLSRRCGRGAPHRLDGDALRADLDGAACGTRSSAACARPGPTSACSATPTRCATSRCARTCAMPTPPS